MTATLQAPVSRRTPRRRLADGWPRFLLRRAGGLLLSIILLVVATFLIIPLLPGDPAVAILGTRATPEAIANLQETLHLNDPILVRFGDYIGGLLHFDLGTSYRFNTPVSEIVTTKLPYTLALAGWSIVFVVLVAIPLGMCVGVLTRGGRRNWLSITFGTVAGFLASVPGYVTGTLLVIVFSISLGLLPPGGATTSTSGILPVVALALGPTFAVSRVVREETQAIIEEDFMRTARGRRLAALRLYLVHALPNILTSTLTLCGLILTGMIGMSIIIENVFNLPGVGSEIVQAIVYKDYPVVQGIVLVLGLLALVLNLVIDIVLGLIDPRILGEAHHG